MRNSKLIAVFKVLDPKQLRSLSDFVNSPFFNKKKEVILLFEYLKKQHKSGFSERVLKKTTVFSKVFLGAPYDEKQLKYAMSDLLRLLHRFISISFFEKDGMIPHSYRLDFFIEKNLENDYRRDLRIAKRKVTGLPISDDRSQQLYLLEKIQEKYSLREQARKNSHVLQKTMDSFDAYYFLKKLQYLCQMLDRETVIPDVFQKYLIEEIEQLIVKGEYPKGLLISIYQSLFLLLRSNHNKYFEKFIKKLNNSLSILEHNEAKSLFYFAINYCIRQIRKGENQFAEDLMDLYVRGVDGSYLLDQGEISPWTYKNMVQLGIGLKRYHWLEDFIKDYSRLLPAEEIDGAYHYNMAQLYYAKDDFIEAYRNLNLSEFSNIHYNIGAKILLLRMYYEEGEEEALFSLLSSFEIYLKRSKLLTGEFKIQYLHFIKTLFQIAKYGSDRKEQIQKRLEKLKVVVARRWLQKRLDDLT